MQPGAASKFYFLLGVLCWLGTVHADTFKTPGNVTKTTIYPLVKWPTTPPIQNCTALPAGTTPLSGIFRAYSGLHEYFKGINDIIQKEWTASPASTRYHASLSANIPSLAASEGSGLCEARLMKQNPDVSYADAHCQCNSQRVPKTVCQHSKNLTKVGLCASQYDVASCANLKSRLASFADISPSCNVPLSGKLHATDLTLFDALYPHGRLPDTFNVTDGEHIIEGKTYYMALAALERLTLFADGYKRCGVEDVLLLPSWTSVLHIYAAQEGETTDIPVATIAKKGNANFLVVVRDMATSFEGRLYAQLEPAFQFIGPISPTITEGQAAILAAISPTLDFVFGRFLKMNFDSHGDTTLLHPRILVVGSGGYGGGLAAVLAHHLAVTWDRSELVWSDKLSIDAIIFSGPLIAAPEFAQSFRSRVNARHITSIDSLSGMLPCSQQILCSTNDAAFATSYSFHTGNVTKFESLGGLVLFDPSTDPGMKGLPLWGAPGNRRRSYILAQTLCGPKCWLSRNFCNKDDTMDYCTAATCPFLG